MSDNDDKSTQQRLNAAAEHFTRAVDELLIITEEELSHLSQKGEKIIEEVLSTSAEKAQSALTRISEALESIKNDNR